MQPDIVIETRQSIDQSSEGTEVAYVSYINQVDPTYAFKQRGTDSVRDSRDNLFQLKGKETGSICTFRPSSSRTAGFETDF